MYSLWSLAVLRADEAGVELARALSLRPSGSPPVTLVGYSLGGRIIFAVLYDGRGYPFVPLDDMITITHHYPLNLEAFRITPHGVRTSLSCLWTAFYFISYCVSCFLFLFCFLRGSGDIQLSERPC